MLFRSEVSLDELLAELEGEETNEELTLDEAAKKEKEDKKSDEKKDEKKSEKKEAKKDEDDLNVEEMSEDDLKSFIEGVIKDMVEAGELEAGHEEGEESEDEVVPEKSEVPTEAPEVAGEEEEEVNVDELLKELEDSEEETKVNDDELEVADAELQEAYKTIENLKKEINEVNLLNVKLLYTNKIFRAKSLTEAQKIKVLSSFDKATTKKEAQLIYETLLEGFKTQPTKSPIKESLVKTAATVVTKTKPIIENDAFARMRELAGIKQK